MVSKSIVIFAFLHKIRVTIPNNIVPLIKAYHFEIISDSTKPRYVRNIAEKSIRAKIKFKTNTLVSRKMNNPRSFIPYANNQNNYLEM